MTLYSQSATVLVKADPETSVQEQALALVRNLVDGPSDSVKYVFDEAGLLLDAIGKKLHSTVKIEVLIQVRSFPMF